MSRRKRSTSNTSHIVSVDMKDIVPYENNPRINKNTVPAVVNSIKTFGFIGPIVLDKYGVIVAGHTRYLAAIELGFTEIPAIYVNHLTEEQVDAFRIIDNKIQESSIWDDELLADQLSILSDPIDFTDYGFTQDELDSILGGDDEDIKQESDEENDDSISMARGRDRVMFSVGEFVFHVDREAYRGWSNHIRTECNFTEDRANRHLKELLGLQQYEEVSE